MTGTRAMALIRKGVKPVFFTGTGLLLVLQVVPGPKRTNPPLDPAKSIEAHVEVPAPIQAILDRSCRNCHSNQTRWPWYSNIAPVSWKVAVDVAKARKIMNFSEWSDQAGKKLEKAAGLLAASCSDVTVGRMPLPEYAFLHTEAMLTKEDIADFCKWTATEGRKIVFRRRQMANPR